jgi:hypothetical protein
MEYVLAMTFLTELGIKSNFTISGIKPDLTSAQVNTLMDTIIAKNIFFTTTGALAKKSGAQITQRTVTKIDII